MRGALDDHAEAGRRAAPSRRHHDDPVAADPGRGARPVRGAEVHGHAHPGRAVGDHAVRAVLLDPPPVDTHVEHVVAGAAVEQVGAAVGAPAIGADRIALAEEAVVARAALDPVRAVAATDEVVAAEPLHDVVARPGHDHVGPRGAAQDVVAGCPDDRRRAALTQRRCLTSGARDRCGERQRGGGEEQGGGEAERGHEGCTHDR